jgi:hypothetical protein
VKEADVKLKKIFDEDISKKIPNAARAVKLAVANEHNHANRLQDKLIKTVYEIIEDGDKNIKCVARGKNSHVEVWKSTYQEFWEAAGWSVNTSSSNAGFTEISIEPSEKP